MRADVDAKTRDAEALRAQIVDLEARLQDMKKSAACTEASLMTRQRNAKARYFDTKLGGLAKPVSPQPHKS